MPGFGVIWRCGVSEREGPGGTRETGQDRVAYACSRAIGLAGHCAGGAWGSSIRRRGGGGGGAGGHRGEGRGRGGLRGRGACGAGGPWRGGGRGRRPAGGGGGGAGARQP